MHGPGSFFRWVLLGPVLANAITVITIIGCAVAVRNSSDRREARAVALTNDITRTLQAQVAAERMVAIGRGYLLTLEPQFLARARAAEAKLAETLRGLSAHAQYGKQRRQQWRVLSAAKRYREMLEGFVAHGSTGGDPRAVAEALREHVIPVRDDLILELDRLAGRTAERLDSERKSIRNLHATNLGLTVALGVVGVLASAFFVTQIALASGAMSPVQFDPRANTREEPSISSSTGS
jgi:CHASE3 domain sensor protein